MRSIPSPQPNQLVLNSSFSKGMSATAYSIVLDKVYLAPIHKLNGYLMKRIVMVKPKLRSSRRAYYDVVLNTVNLRRVTNNKAVVYEFSFTNSRGLDVTKYVIDLNTQRTDKVITEDYYGLLPYPLKKRFHSLKNINTIDGLWLRLSVYGPGMLRVIRQACTILNIDLLVNARILGSIIYQWVDLYEYMLASYTTYPSKSFRSSLSKILQGLHEIYVLMLLGISHYQCSNQQDNIETIMYRYANGKSYWYLKARHYRPTAIIQTSRGKYYTIWYQFQLPSSETPDIVVFKGQYNNYSSLLNRAGINEIILIDAKIKYEKRDHNSLISYIRSLYQYFRPRRISVVLPFLEDVASSVIGNVNPNTLRKYVGNNNLYIIEDVRPGGAGDLKFMETIYNLMP